VPKANNTPQPETNISSVEVAVIGAGPSGLSAAIELAKLGHSNIAVFDREEAAGGVPRHCGHGGFGLAEFKWPMTGPNYAKKLAGIAQQSGIAIHLRHTLISIEDGLLTFSTPKGLKRYQTQRTLLALGARETPRSARLVSGVRSPNIITTGALQRFVYLHDRKPFDRAVVIGTESVGFSALMTCRHAGIDVAAMVDESPRIEMFAPLKPAAEYLLKTPVHTGVEHITIEGEGKEITGVTIERDGHKETIACDGVIFTGRFTPESALMQRTLPRFDHRNNSAWVTQNYQTDDPAIFVAGNALRGALTAFKCYFEGREAAQAIHTSLGDDTPLQTITIEADDAIAWMSPGLIDIHAPHPRLTTLRFKQATKGTLKTFLNGKEVMRTRIDAVPFLNVKLPWFDQDVKAGDRVELVYQAE